MSNPTPDARCQEIKTHLQLLRNQWRLLLFSHNFLRWLALLALSLATVLTADSLMQLPSFLRIGLLVLWLGITVCTAFRYLIRPILKKLSKNRVAAYVDASNSDFENRLLSTVQLEPELKANNFGYATGFIEELTQQAHQSIDRIESKQVFKKELIELKKNGGFAVCALALLILVNLIFPAALQNFVQAFNELPASPQDEIAAQIDEIDPGNTLIQSGGNISISAKVIGHFGAPVHLNYRAVQAMDPANQRAEHPAPSFDKWRSILMEQNHTESSYHIELKNVTQSMDYFVRVNEAASEHFRITVAHHPIVSRFQLKLSFPRYTQLSPHVLEENIGDISALIGTGVQFDGESNKSLASATLIFEESPAVKLKVLDNNHLIGNFIVQRSEKYHVELIDADGISNSQPIVYTIHTIKDDEPKIEIVEPGKDVTLDESMTVNLQIDVEDDYGVQEIRLVYRVEEHNEGDKVVSLKAFNPPQGSAYIEFGWDIDSIGLFPEDVVTYHAEAIDSDNVTGPNVGKSITYSIRFPSVAELYEAIEAQQEIEQHGVEALFSRQVEVKATIDDLLRKIRKSQQFTLKDEKLVNQVFETQKQIEQTSKNIIEDMKKTAEQMDKNQLFDLRTIQKYQELQELMEKALSETHKELLRKLSEALQQRQLSDQERKLMETNFNQEQFVQQLDRLKELYQQLILEQKLEAAATQAMDLAKRQERLMDTVKNLISRANQFSEGNEMGLENLAEQENRVMAGLASLHEKLDELGEKMSTRANLQRVADEIKRLNRTAREREIAQKLQSAGSAIQRSRMRAAIAPGQQAQEGLSDLAQGLENAMEFMGANADAALAAMREAVRDGIFLSHLQERVIDGTEALLDSGHGRYIESEIKRLQRLSASELSISSGITNLASGLWDLGKEQMQIDLKIVLRLRAASDAFARSARALEDRKPSLATPIQKQGLADLNEAILDLIKAMGQMNQQMGMGGLQSMLEQLQEMAQNQQNLNEMAENLHEQMRQQGQTPEMKQLLDRLAYEQEMIREATERLAEMMGSMSQVLGDLNSVSEEMKEVEAELQQGNLNQRVLEKQRRILTRMLESSKSLQKREVNKRRKGEAAKNPMDSTTDAPALDSKLLETVRQIESDLESGGRDGFPPQYRGLIEQYFKALSQETQRGL
ncbi:MAG: hypothetical protein OXP71_05325 [Candidatus Poribacteria bacterium]|nr:hypothetical protein [Candidatus Poribacteria bacterium]